MKRIAFCLITPCWIAANGFAAASAGVVVASGGAPRCAIVVSTAASPSQLYAAEELRRFTKEMTGADLKITRDDGPLPDSAILLGETRHGTSILGAGFNVAAVGDDGFRIVSKPPHVLVLGGPVRGTLYGVYELLERNGGCRWYAKHHALIPKHAEWSIPVMDITQQPAFPMREPFWWGMFDGDFAARSRANGNAPRLEARHGGKITFGQGFFVHTFNTLVPPAEFFGTHPEYFSEIGGKRTAERAQLCLTNPDVLRIATERILAAIRKNPSAKLFSVSQNDWHGACECASCSAIDEREGSHSGTMIAFVNRVAEAVEKEFPDVWIETLAYQYTRRPPKTVRPRTNVVPRLCSIECDFSKPIDGSTYEQNLRFVEDIRGWAAITDKLYVWDYVTNFGHYLGPHPNFGALAGNVRFFKANRVVGLFEQGAYQSPHAEFAELRAWVLAKLLWDPTREMGELYDDFFAGYYGPAAAPVRAYFNSLQKIGASKECVLRIGSPPDAAWYPGGFFERGAKLWEEAEQLASGDARFGYNVRMGAMSVMYARLMRWPRMDVRHVWRDGAYRPVGVDAEYAELAMGLLKRMKEGGVTHLAENADRHAQLEALWRGRTEGFSPVKINSGGWTVGVVPEMGGRVVQFHGDDGRDLVSPEGGGLDAVEGRDRAFDPGDRPYGKIGGNTSEIHLSRDRRGPIEVFRDISVKDGQLSATAKFINRKTVAHEMAPILRVALPMSGGVCVKPASSPGGWKIFSVPKDQTYAISSLPPEQWAGRDLLVFGGEKGIAARLQLPNVNLDRLWLLADARGGFARLFVACAPTNLPPGGSIELPIRIAATRDLGELPEAPAPVAHRAGRVAIEDVQFRLGRPGEWGEIGQDPSAEDGYAAKLFGTHHEWCLQWPVEPELFEKGARYRARLRLRVEKSGTEGTAFWAGIYDAIRRKGVAQIHPKAAELADGYHWYDIGTWVPEAGQYLWAGPGMIPKGGKSAVKNVFIDRAEMIRVETPAP